MAFTPPFTAVTGAVFTAAQWNTSGRDNLNALNASVNALLVGTTAGDIEYYTGLAAKTRLGITNGGLLKGGASAPSWLANVAGGLLKGGTSAPEYLAPGNTFNVLMFDASANAPIWASFFRIRQGGNSSNWQTPGTSNYDVANSFIQVGVLNVTTNSGGEGSVTVTYPVTFSQRPIILATIGGSSSGRVTISFSDDSTSGCTFHVIKTDLGVASYQINWMAVGNWT